MELETQISEKLKQELYNYIIYNGISIDNIQVLDDDEHLIKYIHLLKAKKLLLKLNSNLSIDLVELFKESISWIFLTYLKANDLQFINHFKNLINWDVLSRFSNLDENTISTYRSYVNWDYVSETQSMSDDFIILHEDYINFNILGKNPNLSQNIITKYFDKFNIDDISKNNNLTSGFLIKKKRVLNWNIISNKRDFIHREYLALSDYIKWDSVIKRIALTELNIRKFIHKIDFSLLVKYQKLSSEFLTDYFNELNLPDI